jgi:hypothetical protein
MLAYTLHEILPREHQHAAVSSSGFIRISLSGGAEKADQDDHG